MHFDSITTFLLASECIAFNKVVLKIQYTMYILMCQSFCIIPYFLMTFLWPQGMQGCPLILMVSIKQKLSQCWQYVILLPRLLYNDVDMHNKHALPTRLIIAHQTQCTCRQINMRTPGTQRTWQPSIDNQFGRSNSETCTCHMNNLGGHVPKLLWVAKD